MDVRPLASLTWKSHVDFADKQPQTFCKDSFSAMATVRFLRTCRKFKYLFPRAITGVTQFSSRTFCSLSHQTPISEDSSIHHYEQLLAQNPDDPQNISNLAMEYFLNDDTDRANELYLDALSRHHTNGDLHFYYAHFLFNCMKDMEQSLQYALSSVECNNVSPPLSSPYILLAQIYGMQQDMEEAQKYLDIAIHDIGDDQCTFKIEKRASPQRRAKAF